ncbi:hypothetical protein IE4771_CH03043 [Rhizobium etli bv. mimosae str. IE4771]|uniref:Uncharacterized protein n=1 Tax=Rhizobium etli bv. mimosae str. IE4771 TaxID=1432050 RepID=A0A060I2W1_RHIET|nr:hypothetical protein [Rhizobium sp. IE4771]AIC28137.1 hypothetical protein IE4771_CH03043 [Rhizobium sp. IE4771]
MKTTEDWYAIGYEEGVRAGNSDMAYKGRDFGPHEGALAEVYALHDGECAVVTRSYLDFSNHDLCSSWMAGVIEGSMSVGARMGGTTGTPDIASGVPGAMRLHLFIVKDFPPTDATWN